MRECRGLRDPAEPAATGRLSFHHAETGAEVLREAPAHFWWPGSRHFEAAGAGFHRIAQRFAAYADERIYGLGQHGHGRLDQKGMVLVLAQRNGEVSIPFALSSLGYGLLWNSPAVGRVEFAANGTRWVADRARQIDYWLTVGHSPAVILTAYAAAIGFPSALLAWASGFWQSKLRYRDQSAGQANVLIGNDSGQTGTTTVTVQGLGSTSWLTAGSTVHATLLRIPDQTPVNQPTTVSNADVTISNGRISLPVTFQSGTDAYWLVLSPHGVPAPPGPGGSSNGTTIVDGNVTGTGNNQFQYGANWGLTTGVSDMYLGTANWSFVAGATATFRFTGTQVALHAVRDVDQGIMTVSVDGGAAQSIDNYAASRNASGVVWTSPTLSSASHTVTIVNTGNRNSASSGINIALDRADVTQ